MPAVLHKLWLHARITIRFIMELWITTAGAIDDYSHYETFGTDKYN